MDKIKILDIFINLFNKYLNNNLTQQQILTTIEEISKKKTNLELIPYKETETIYLILKEIPYYKISEILEEFIMILEIFSLKTLTITPIYLLLKAYLKDLADIIQKRIDTEILIHIYEMAENYYLRLSSERKKQQKRLLINISKIYETTGLYIAQNAKFTQITLPGIQNEKTEYADQISKARFNIKDKTEKYFYQTIKAYLNENDFNCLIDDITTTIITSEINTNERETLLTLYTSALNEIKKKLYQTKKNKKTNQLYLRFN